MSTGRISLLTDCGGDVTRRHTLAVLCPPPWLFCHPRHCRLYPPAIINPLFLELLLALYQDLSLYQDSR